MRVVIDIQDAAELERAVELLREHGIDVHVGGDGGPPLPMANPERRQQEFIDALRQFRGVLPPDYSLDRDGLHDRNV